MERLSDYRCPPECERRSVTCHCRCERYEKYQKINAERKEAKARYMLSYNYAHEKKIHKTEGRFAR